MDFSKFENQCAILVCCLLAAALIQGCGASHLATPDAGTPSFVDDAGPVPVGDAAIAADAGPSFYEWPDAGPAPTPVDAGSSDEFFCEPWTLGGVSDGRFGYRGCCTDGAFPTADHVEPGMLVKGSGPAVYYIAADGSRYVFASTHYLASWFLDPSRDVPFGEDDFACSQVVEIPDALLASIRISGNVPMRPGVITTGISTDPKRYVITHGNVLRWIEDDSIDLDLAEPWLDGRDILTPDAFFVSFCIGSSIHAGGSPYDGQSFYEEATIQYEIDHYCGG